MSNLLSPDRKEFAFKICNEIYSNALSITSDNERRKEYFLQSVKENKKLSETEKQYCKEKFLYDLELSNALQNLGNSRVCNECKSTRCSDRFCEKCISLHLQSLFNSWTSGNDIVDKFIRQCQINSSVPTQILEWIPYEQFKDVKMLGKGGFSSVYNAIWTRGGIVDYDEEKKKFSYVGAQYVALKSLRDSSNPGKHFFEEALNYSKIRSTMIVPCYGITKFPERGNYAMVLNYVPEGNLRNYLQKNHLILTLKDKIMIFRCLCKALYHIHDKDLIHCDLHSGNILIEGGNCYITDLGLCGSTDEELTNKIYGIIPYLAPELLDSETNTKNTKESDIYSVGMLMWEIIASHPPFDNRPHNYHLIFDICEGIRPPVLPGTPDDYAQMMQKCWDADPSKRPTIEDLLEFVNNSNKKLNEIPRTDNLNTVNKNDMNNLFKRIFKFSKKKKKEVNLNGSDGSRINSSKSTYKSHQYAYHKSRILDDEITKSKNLKNDYSLSNDNTN